MSNHVYQTFVLPSGKTAKIRGLTGEEQNILANKKKIKQNGLDEFITSCSDQQLEKMLLGDKFFILFQIRRLTYGDKYSFKFRCPDCDENGIFFVKLNEFDIKYLKDRKVEGLQEGQTDNIEYTLPTLNKKVKFRLLRHEDEKLMEEISKTKEDSIITAMLTLRTTWIEGEQMITEEFFKKAPGLDNACYREFMDECDCGIDTSVVLICKECKSEFEIDLPMNPDFFLPKKVRNK